MQSLVKNVHQRLYLILLNLRGGVGLNLKIRGYTRINYQEFSIDPKYYR